MAKKSDDRSWYSMRNAGSGVGEISILSDIGEWGISARDFRADLKNLGAVDELHITISSNGGDVSQGFAIYNALERHAARKVVTIDGLAASMASVIAMVGDEVEIPANSMLMIHNPWGSVVGESDSVISFGKALEKMQGQIADTYVKRTGMKRDEVLKLMDRESWLDASEAVELGFADRIGDASALAKIDVSKFKKVPAPFGRLMEKAKMAKAPKNQNEQDDTETADDVAVKTPEEIRADLLASQNEIRSLCKLAGKPELADKFITEDKSPAEVLKALTEESGDDKDEQNNTSRREVSARNNPNRKQDREVKTLDPVAIWSKWNKKKSAA